jgi:hypothetical protein
MYPWSRMRGGQGSESRPLLPRVRVHGRVRRASARPVPLHGEARRPGAGAGAGISAAICKLTKAKHLTLS